MPERPRFFNASTPPKTRTRRCFLAVSLMLSSALVCSAVHAETQQECELSLRPQTRMAAGTGLGGAAGGLGGAIAGAAACTGFLGAAFFDFGISYATCLA